MRKQRNAAKKVSRIRRSKGVDIKLTSHDPRVNAAKIAKYTTKQLIAHAKRLDEFNSRRTGFVAGSEGQPLPKAKVERLLKLVEANNIKARQRVNSRKDVKLPGSKVTIGQRAATLDPDRLSAQGVPVNAPYVDTKIDVANINGLAALDKMVSKFEKVLSKGHLPKQIKQARHNMRKMLIDIGAPDLVEKMSKLTDHQFDIYFFDAKRGNEIIPVYALMQMQIGADTKRVVLEDHYDEIAKSLDWAADLPERG